MKPEKTDTTRIPFFSNGTLVLIGLMVVGFSFGVVRMISGLDVVTNLSDNYPWGIWIGIDVACGVALAAGGFCTAALVEISGKKEYKPLIRSALLTAWLGYIFVGIGLSFDLGRYWNIWRPSIHWQGNSVLFEVGMCVMAYLTVLSVEMAPVILTGLIDHSGAEGMIPRVLKRFRFTMIRVRRLVRLVMPVFVVAGVVLSCMHQSSLGTLMLIAPTKLSALWYTPFLPALFLLSAIMVGFAMVIFESIVSSSAFRTKDEMSLLTPLSKVLAFFIGTYAVFKVGDLIVRRPPLGEQDAVDIVAFAVEIGAGLILPLLMLFSPSIRRSRRWLFIASVLVVVGVIMNRLNVFVIGFHPPFAAERYQPAIGEVALTVGLFAALMFCYRFFAYYFPVLPGQTLASVPPGEGPAPEEKVSPRVAWAARIVGVAFLVAFVFLYAAVHRHAQKITRIGREPLAVVRPPRAAGDLPFVPHAGRPQKYSSLLSLNSPLANALTDEYEPVRFSHRSHDSFTRGNCTVCHHRVPREDGDRIGRDVAEMHRANDVAAAGPCQVCHDDPNEIAPPRCDTCHQRPGEPDAPARPGLKGAFHGQCMDCHRRVRSERAPLDCRGCHHPNVPDHEKLAAFDGEPGPFEVTAKCLECHADVGRDVLASMHWNWRSDSPGATGTGAGTGRARTVDNYFISAGANFAGCACCHIGYGPANELYNDTDPAKIDCLVCHDTTGTYRKKTSDSGMPREGVDLALVARKVGRPSKEACASCHLEACSGPNAKHGDLDACLADDPDLDIHTGRNKMRCQDCHTVEKHRIAGQSLAIPASEGRVGCATCHGDEPHTIAETAGYHANRHGKHVACQTCHIPYYATATPTNLSWDWSTAGEDRPDETDEMGMITYSKDRGTLTWGMNVAPHYRWYNGEQEHYIAGGKIKLKGRTDLTKPIGNYFDPASKIAPFKVHTGVQPADAKNNILALPTLAGGYWGHYDWQRAVASGMEAAGLEFSGEVAFVKTRMFHLLNHGVMPGKKALSCGDCHDTDAVQCARCHDGWDDKELVEYVKPRYGDRSRFDWDDLGYIDDPANGAARFRLAPLPGGK